MHSGDISVRRARAADIPQLCDLLAELFSIESDFSPDGEKQTQGLTLFINDTAGSLAVFVAEKDGEIIGMCSVQTLISTAEGGPAGFVEDVIVRREYRGRGIGSLLLSEIVRWSIEKNITRLQLLAEVDNERALKFYARSGWTTTNLTCMRKIP
jgi:ribosomal protein S18 acetylase RimI-like enzyme